MRGTNGSGKSFVVRSVLEQFGSIPIYGVLGPKRPEAYEVKVRGVKKTVYVLGPYHVGSGGLDQVQPYQLVLDLIKKYSVKGHVLFEGVIVSSSYGQAGRLMETLGHEVVMGFMQTPVKKCIKNVEKRRKLKGDLRPFNPENLLKKHKQIETSRRSMQEAGKVRIVDLYPNNAVNQVLALLGEAK